MQQIITEVKIAQWLKLLTSIHFVYGREFESQTGIFIFLFYFFFCCCWLALFSCFFSQIRSGVHSLHGPRIYRDSQVNNKIVLQKNA